MTALRTETDWKQFLKKAGITDIETTAYAKTLHNNRILHPENLNKEILKELDIIIIGDQTAILKHAQIQPDRMPTKDPNQRKVSFTPQVTLPRINSEMSPAEFPKFKFKRLACVQEHYKNASQLYTACDGTVQTSIVNYVGDVLTLD